MPSEPRFLTKQEAVALHAIAVHRYGGASKLIDEGKLDSALAAPSATFDGKLLNKSIEEQAAAYWHGLCQAHAFLDGNKRFSLFATFAFLDLNGFDLEMSSQEAEETTMSIARGQLSKDDLADFLQGRVVSASEPT